MVLVGIGLIGAAVYMAIVGAAALDESIREEERRCNCGTDGDS